MTNISNIKTWSTRAKNAAAALLFLTAYTISMVAPFIPVAQVSAAQICTPDKQGVDDEPGQKDLTRMCKDNAGLPTSQQLVWNYDDTGWTGNNTGDACALYDTDNDGFANYSVCVTVTGTPATQAVSSPRIYSCDDNSVDKCFSATLQPLNGTTCSVSITATQPFATGDNSPNDTTATCTVTSASVGGATAALIDVCSYPSQQPNSDPSDCIISVGGGKIEVRKSLSPTTDPGTFNLSVAGTVYATGGNGTTTGERAVAKGVTAFAETGAAGTLLSGYNISVECKSANGTGSTLSVTTTGTGAFSVDVPEDSDIVCIITNTRQTGTVILVKSVTNNNGGTLGVNDFGLTIGGNAATSGQAVTLPAGVPVAINEAGATGYSFVSITGTGCPAALGGTVTPVNGQNITCTITNDDQAAHLTLVKSVTTDNGGTALPTAWTLNASGPTPISGTTGASAVTNATVSAGTYNLSETNGPSGYTASSWVCVGGTQNGASVSLTLGQSATCTITNDDQAASLTLIKNVTNDNGGTALPTAWTLNASGPTPLTGTTGAAAVTNAPVSVGTYNLSETGGPTGYTASSWVCVGGQQNGASVALTEGQSATCTITNNDNSPYLQLVKTVTNDNGGTEPNTSWTLIATGSTQATSFQGTTGVNSGSVTNFLAGSYTLSESGPSGYTGGTWSCQGGSAINGVIQLVLGQSATCTINNNDNAPTLTLNKILVKDNGGTANESDWTLTANGGAAGTISGPGAAGSADVVSGATFKAGTYTLSESAGPSGYTAGSWSCTGKTVTNSQVTINLGDNVTCSITNNDQPGTLIVNKVLTNDNGGTKTVQNFSYTVNGGSSLPFEADASNSQSVNAGSYSVVEVADSDYATTYGNSLNGNANCSNLVVPNGGQATCTITNNDKAPKLTLNKILVKDNGGTANESDWTLTANGGAAGTLSGPGAAGSTDVVSGASFDQGTYTLSESAGPSGYSASTWSCTGKTVTNNQVTINLDDDITCTITNDDNAPSLTLVKYVTNNNGGTRVAADWTLSATGPTSISGAGGVASGASFDQGTYTLGETTIAGYHVGVNWSCTPVANTGTSITLALGQSTTCQITNDDDAASLSGTKTIANTDLTWTNDGKPPVSGWVIYLDQNQNGVLDQDERSTTTDTDGNYSFGDLVAGVNYYVKEVVTSLGNGWEQITGVTNPVNLTLGQSSTGNNFSNKAYGHITVIKQLEPSSDEGKFNLLIDGTAKATNVGDEGTTGSIKVEAGTHSVSELAGTGTNLANYNSSWWCGNLNSLVPVNVGTSTSIIVHPGEDQTCTFTNTRKLGTVKVVKDVVNDNGGTKTAANDFTFKNNNGTAQTFVATTSPDGERVLTLPVGSGFSIVEPEANSGGYTTSYSGTCSGTVTEQEQTCTIKNDDNAPKLTLNKILVKDNGGTATEGNWTLTANGGDAGTLSGTGAAGSTDVVSGATFKAGTYTLSESAGPSGYSASAWSCTDDKTPNVNNQITINLDDDVTCTITNNDIAPSLTLIKHVTNDNGGTQSATDWTLSATGATSISGAGGALSDASFDAGTYTLGETTVAGYHVGINWSCTPVANTGTSITLALGQSTTCHITNDDNPASISGTKTITNTDLTWVTQGMNPVSGWVIYLDQNQNGVLDQDERSTTTDADGNYSFGDLVAGVNYYVKEVLNSLGSGWAQITGVNNPVNPTLGQNVTGKNFSNEARGKITVIKNVNDGFGHLSQDVTNWTWSYDGKDADKSDIATGSNNSQVVPSGTYAVTEMQKDGYHVTSSVCTNAPILTDRVVTENSNLIAPNESQSILVGLNGDVTCTFVNTRDTGTLKVNKVVDDGYGNKTTNPDGWTWDIEYNIGSGYEMGYKKTLVTGSYDFKENQHPDYTFTSLTCTRDGDPFEVEQDEEASVEIGYNENVECTFTNTRKMGDLTIVKDAQPNSTQEFEFNVEPVLVDDEDETVTDFDEDRFTEEGTAPDEFDLVDSSDSAESREKTLSLPTGWYVVTETTVTGWDLTDLDCGDTDWFVSDDNQLAVKVGNNDKIECTFTNTKRAELTVIKDVQPDSTKAFSFTTDVAKDKTGANTTFSLVDDGSGLGTNSKKFANVLPGTYTITEDQLSGWKLDNIVCTGTGVTMTRDGAKLTVKLAAGAVASCTFVNSFIPQVLAETFPLAPTGTSTIVTTLLATLLTVLATALVWYRRKATVLA